MGRLDGTYHIKNHIKRQGMTLQLTLGKCSSISEMAVIGLGIPPHPPLYNFNLSVHPKIAIMFDHSRLDLENK